MAKSFRQVIESLIEKFCILSIACERFVDEVAVFWLSVKMSLQSHDSSGITNVGG